MKRKFLIYTTAFVMALLTAVSVTPGHAQGSLYFNPTVTNSFGGSIAVDFNASNISNLQGVYIRMKYNPAVMQFSSFTNVGDILVPFGGPCCIIVKTWADSVSIEFARSGSYSLYGQTSGRLFTINFTAVNVGTSPIQVTKLELRDPSLNLILPTSVSNGTVNVKLGVNLKAFLEAPYNGTTGMYTWLKDYDYIPTSQPFTASPWMYLGSEVSNPIPDGTVDWMLVELRTTATGAAIAQRAALLLNNGAIRDVDGISPVHFPTVSVGSYYVVLRPRNHLAVMSANPVPLGLPASTYDFTTGQATAYQDLWTYGNDAMVQISSSPVIFALWGGDSNPDGFIDSQDFLGADNNQFTDGYFTYDATMDGFVDAMDFILPDNHQFLSAVVP